MVIGKFDLRNVSKVVGTSPTAVAFGLEPVPTGMKRFFTFLDIHNKYGGEQRLWVCSAAASTTASTAALASATAKMRFLLQTGDHLPIPPHGPTDPERPLFSIAADKYLAFHTDKGDAYVNFQFYDAS